METFLREVEAKLTAMPEGERRLQIERLLQLFKAAAVMKEVFKFKGGLRFAAWLIEQSVAKTHPDRIAGKMRDTATKANLPYVLSLIDAAAS